MNRAKIFIIFVFLLVIADCVSAQDKTPRIIWKNLQEKYENFYEITPVILNESNFSIYYDAYFFPYVDFEMFDKKSNSWIVSRGWSCGTGYKPSIKKIRSSKQIPFDFGKSEWDEITTIDSINDSKFRRFSDYNGTGRYRFKFIFGVEKTAVGSLVSYSPEFVVIEKDFNK